jgi:hypothetical protein
MENAESVKQERSTFVSATAWIFIVLSGFGTFISLMQNIMVHFMFSLPEVQTAMNSNDMASQMPPFVHFIFSHFRLFVFLMFVVVLFTLISAIGLLKRKDWARKTFIGMLSIAILVMLGSIVAQFFFFHGFSELRAPDVPVEMKTMMHVMQGFFILFYAGIAVLFGWIIKKLLSPAISLEFHRQD